MKRSMLIFSTLWALLGCKEEDVALGVHCEASLQATTEYSSALAYGVDMSVPRVEDVHPLREEDFFDVRIPDTTRTGLISNDAAGDIYYTECRSELCNIDDALKALGKCKNNSGCKVSGFVKNNTFYPIYESDSDGGHICSSRVRP